MNENHINILLVEDSDTDALLLEHDLMDSPFGPFVITLAGRLDEALGLLRAQRFDVVLLDLGLPDSQGLETLKRMHRQTVMKTPIVVLTGLDDEALGERALQEGAADYLVKNCSGATMRARALRYATERQRSSEASLATERQLALAVDAAELGIFDWDLATGDITWSFHSARLLGLAPEQFEGTFEAFERCVHPDDRAGIHLAIKRSLAADEEYRHEYRVIWPDVSEHWIETRGKLFRDVQGQPVRRMGSIMNISHRKAVEAAAEVRELESGRLLRANLTPRELTLLKLIVNGMPNKRIASELHISVRTVAKHRSHLMSKTQAHNAADLARMSTLAGVISVR